MGKQMKLKCLSHEAYDDLCRNFDANKKAGRYKKENNDFWLPEYFGGEGYALESSIEIGGFSLISGTEDISEEDLINAKALYDACKNITRQQASNEYLWAYLCHLPENRCYISTRWETDESTGAAAKQRYLGRQTKQIMSENALSRLWWGACVTYDDEAIDHYHLTRILFRHQSLFKDFMDTNRRMSFTMTRAVLKALDDYFALHQERLNMTNTFRELNKYLNKKNLMIPLEFLSEEELYSMSFNFLESTSKKQANAA